jgi:hypothetical protein
MVIGNFKTIRKFETNYVSFEKLFNGHINSNVKQFVFLDTEFIGLFTEDRGKMPPFLLYEIIIKIVYYLNSIGRREKSIFLNLYCYIFTLK